MQRTRSGFGHRKTQRKRATLPLPGARNARRSGFSLLEVILALTLLAGAVVVLGEIGRLAMKSASGARDLARAQMLCESKMSEVVSGFTPASSGGGSFDSSPEADTADDPRWKYSIDTQSTDEEGLIAVRVTVTKEMPAAQHPVNFSLVRWMVRPELHDRGGTIERNVRQRIEHKRRKQQWRIVKHSRSLR